MAGQDGERNAPEDFAAAATGCLISRNRLIEQNLPLVDHVASTLAYQFRCEKDDLYQVGIFGLINAIRLYQPGRGKFSTYALRAIRNTILDYIKRDSAVRIVKRAEADRPAAPETVMLRQARCERWDTAALDEIPFRASVADVVEDWETVSPEMLQDWLQQLTPRQRLVVQLHLLKGIPLAWIRQHLPRLRRDGSLDGYGVSLGSIRFIKQLALRQLARQASRAGFRATERP